MEKQHSIWHLLVKKDRGEASVEELQELEGLLKEEPTIEAVNRVLDHYWAGLKASPENEQMMAIADSNRLLAEMKRANEEPQAPQDNRHRIKRIMAIAAMLLAILGGVTVLYYLFIGSAQNKNIVRTKDGSRTEVILPDGTRVNMNGGSVLSYPDNFNHATKREVTISGEAFFDVKHDSTRPFIIHTEYLDIKDIGTVFNVRAYPGEAAEATLISGSIEVNIRNHPDKVLRPQPQEKVVYDAAAPKKRMTNRQTATPSSDAGIMRIIKVAPIIANSGDTIVPETAWTKNQFVFQSEPFESLAGRMEHWFDVKIRFESEEVSHYVFTGIFEGETLAESLRELQLSRPFNFEIMKDSVLITDYAVGL